VSQGLSLGLGCQGFGLGLGVKGLGVKGLDNIPAHLANAIS